MSTFPVCVLMHWFVLARFYRATPSVDPAQYFNGDISQLAYFDSALSRSDVKYHFGTYVSSLTFCVPTNVMSRPCSGKPPEKNAHRVHAKVVTLCGRE